MVWDELHQSGLNALERGEYSEAERYLQKAVAEAKQDQANVATSLYSLGQVYSHLQDYPKAEASLTRALAIRGKVLGLEHAEVARVIDELGIVYFNEQKYSQAEPLLRRGLEMRAKLLGEKHPETAESMVSLATWCETEKQPQEAEKLLRQALKIQEETLGRDDVKLAPTLGLQAVHYFNKKEYGQAEELARRALAIRETSLGATHPDVAMSLHVLAMIALAQHDFAKAETSYRRALTIREKYLPPSHSGILSVLRNLGISYYCQNKLAQADETYNQLEGIAEIAGNNQDMLLCWRQRSWIRFREKRLKECEKFAVRALERMKELEIQDKTTTDSLNLCLFSCYMAQKNYVKAAQTLPSTAITMGKRLFNKNGAKTGNKKPVSKSKELKDEIDKEEGVSSDDTAKKGNSDKNGKTKRAKAIK
jgi:tetratricopeptide (TPR) repeat protein